MSLSDNNQAFNSTASYQDGLLNIDKTYFTQMVSQIYNTDF